MTSSPCTNAQLAALGARVSVCPRPAITTVTIAMKVPLFNDPVMVDLCNVHLNQVTKSAVMSVIAQRPVHDDHTHTLPPNH